MGEITRILVKSGIVPEDTLHQLKKWGADIDVVPDPPPTTDAVPGAIQRAIEEEDFVRIRETDLEVLKHYLRTQTKGMLHLDNGVESDEFDITYGRTPYGEVIIPWNRSSIEDEMLNGVTFLRTEHGEDLRFSDMREVYYGEDKAFMVLLPEGAQG